MICTSIKDKTYAQIVELLSDGSVEMAEIRLDLCPLEDGQIEELFSQSDVPLVATCRVAEVGENTAFRRLETAIRAGARYADLEIEAPVAMSKAFQKLCRECGTEIIRSYHDFSQTPSDEVLQMVLARCFRYGCDVAKIVTTCLSEDDAARIESLYSVVLEDVPSMEGRLLAFGMGQFGRPTRLECLRRGAPFSYAALTEDDSTAPGQIALPQMRRAVYGDLHPYVKDSLQMPASKSFAQRSILAAALCSGTSVLSGYSSCSDSDAALSLARSLGAKVSRTGDVLEIEGIGAAPGCLSLDKVFVGESGLLSRLSIPVLSVLNSCDFSVEGEGTLLSRPLKGASDIMASFGVLASNAVGREGKDVFIPARIHGSLVPGNAVVPGSGGSQLISGLLMALPLCSKDSKISVTEPKSIPYMYITLDVLRRFGIQTRSEMEGDERLIEDNDWAGCSQIDFKVRAGQRYRAASFRIEGDWSAAAVFLVAGAVFGSVSIEGLDCKSLQADISILDILVDAGAMVSELEDGTVCARKAPLEAFETDLNNAPDLFPVVAFLACFCAGESRIAGVGRLHSKESDRAAAIVDTLTAMGVEVRLDQDFMYICGESLASRCLNSRLLRGGEYSSFHDHRMVMLLKLASLACSSEIVIDDEKCVAKSFPDFDTLFA